MPTELAPCHLEAILDEHEADIIIHNVYQYLDTLSSGSRQRRTRSQTYNPAFVVDFLSEQLLHAPFKVFAATTWLQAKVLDISCLCPEVTLQAINDSNKRLIASVTEAKEEAYKTEDGKRNHLDRIEKSLQRPLTDIFNRWTPEGPSRGSQLAVGTLAAIERAVALSPHLTPNEISIALNAAVNGPGITADELGKKPSQNLIQALCRRLETTPARTPIDSNAREVNPRLQRFSRQKRQTSSSPSTSVSKRQCTSTRDSPSPESATRNSPSNDSPSPERARHAVTPLSDRGVHDDWDDVTGRGDCDISLDLVEGEDLGTQHPTHQLTTSDLEKAPEDGRSDRFVGYERTTGTDELITPPSSRQSSTVPFAFFPETDATCNPYPQTMSDLQGTYHRDLEKDLHKNIERSKATIILLQPELQERWQAYLSKESEHETAIRRVGGEFETWPRSSTPPSLIDARKRKDHADAQDKRWITMSNGGW